VAGAFTAALRARDNDVRLMIPAYGLLDRGKLGLEKKIDSFNITMGWRNELCQMWTKPNTGDCFITNYYFFDNRFQVYTNNDDEVAKFVLFCRAALEACHLDGWEPDIIHANDWHTAAAIRLAWAGRRRPGLVYTIHNIEHQGNQAPYDWELLGVYNGIGDMNLMQQAIITADVVTTVSPSYAEEICTREGGCGLGNDLLAKQRDGRLFGVLNGIDMTNFDPSTDRSLPANYTSINLENKKYCKQYLQDEMGLEDNPSEPLIGIVTNLESKQGTDLVIELIERIMNCSQAQIIVLGNGSHRYETALQQAADRYRGRVAAYIGIDENLERQIYAGSDVFLMPGMFEPCGFRQLIAMRYGALPVARGTGGLRDTIVDMRSIEGGCGYLFSQYESEEIANLLLEVVFRDYRDSKRWNEAICRAMSLDFSWGKTAAQYERLYDLALQHL
ncbi:glycogen synthase, partial [bacterium]|nr:glycogen synthase [bacterium]